MSTRDLKQRPKAKAGGKPTSKPKAAPVRAVSNKKATTKAGSVKKAPVTKKLVVKKAVKPANKKPQAKTKALAAKASDAKHAVVATSDLSNRTAKVQSKVTARAKSSPIVLPPDYVPSDGEPFMNEMHRMYFRQKLLTWKEDIIRQTRETLMGLHDDSTQHADIADRATSETDRALELRSRDRQRKLVSKIDAALARIEDGSYGYCEETGEPIGLKRLDARPIATLSLEAQERHERRERVYRED